MNKIYIKIVFTLVFGVIHLCIFSQSFPIRDLVGQYPLRSKDKNSTTSFPRFTEVGVWDISLEGNHGKVVPNSGVKANKSFEVTEFKNQTYIKGIAKGKIQLNKDPFESYLDDFTIAFWIEKGANGSILQTNLLLIDMSLSGELNIHWKNSSSERVGHLQLTDSDETDDGWYNFALVYAKSSRKLTIYLNGTLKKEFTLDLLTQRYDNSAALMPLSDFMGGLANVSFAKTSYDINQLKALNDILTDDEQYAKRKFRHYPLDAPNLGKEIISGKGALEVNGVGYTLNRNGESNKAANFDKTGSIILPYLFGENPVTDDYDETRGVTISLWMKIETPESTTQEGIFPVFDPLKDTFYSVLYGIDDVINAKAPIFGLQRVRDRLGINTYINRSDNTKHPWYNWFYDPVDFRNKTGWFHIVYVQHQNWTKVYVVKNNESVNSNCNVGDWICWRNCQIHYDYNSFLSIDDVKEWGLGSWGLASTAHAVIDDLSIYRWPMDVEQVTALHNYERYNSSNKNSVTSKQKEIALTQEIASKFVVSPNPSKGTFSLDFNLKKESPTRVEIVNLEGQLIFKKNYPNLIKGNHTLQFDINDVVLLSGIYIIKIVTNEFNESNKLIIQ